MTDSNLERKIQDLKARLSLLAEVEKDLGPGRKSGRWLLFSCPFPGHKHGDSKPSLSVTPDNGRYFCFTCRAAGDVITWLKEYRGMPWKDILELDDSGAIPAAAPRQAAPTQPQKQPSQPPGDTWQARGLAFVEECEKELWSGAGRTDKVYKRGPDLLTPWEYLLARGLSPQQIQSYRLGYNPRDLYDKRESWGLTFEVNEKGNEKKVKKEQGITIPCLITSDWATQQKDLWYIKIRRLPGKINPVTGAPDKYTGITGGQAALFGADNMMTSARDSAGAGIGLLTEGEFDAILADQIIGDICGVATLGSASKGLDLAAWGPYLMPLGWLLAAYDLDPAGKKGLADLLGQAGSIHPVRVPALNPGDKDITDYHLAGGDLYKWLRYNLAMLGVPEAQTEPEEIPAELQAAYAAGRTNA